MYSMMEAKLHTGKQNVDKLTDAGSGGGWSIQYVTQPTQSGFKQAKPLLFYSPQRNADALNLMFSSVKRAFPQYDTDKLKSKV